MTSRSRRPLGQPRTSDTSSSEFTDGGQSVGEARREPNDAAARLRDSESVVSLLAEQECVQAFQALGWARVGHGHFYRDPTTGKMREVDVTARCSVTKARKSGNLSASITVFVELKSIPGYHVVFAPSAEGDNDCCAITSWCGYSVDDDDALSLLARLGLDARQAVLVANRFRRSAYPRGHSRVWPIQVDPPKRAEVCTAFRETNIGQEKDLDASVVWRAMQSVWAATEAARQRDKDVWVESLVSAAKSARLFHEDPLPILFRNFDFSARTIAAFHPAVVCGANLWLLRNSELRPVPFVRFIEVAGSQPPRWCDVISKQAFPEWLTELTGHYAKASDRTAPPRFDRRFAEGVVDAMLKSMGRRSIFERGGE